MFDSKYFRFHDAAVAVAVVAVAVVVGAATSADVVAAHEQLLAGYEPLTSIHDYASIDLDMQVMEQLTDFGLVDLAKAIYEKGGHSRSVSKLTLVNANPPLTTIPAGTKVVGRNMDDKVIQGTLLESAMWEEGTERVSLLVEYETRPNQTSFCHLGGLASAGTAELKGCFQYGGVIQILDFSQGAPVYSYKYGYEPYLDTYNIASFQRMSTMLDMPLTSDSSSSGNGSSGDNAGSSPHYKISTHTSSSNSSSSNDSHNQQSLELGQHYAKYVSYYAANDYADQFIQAALDARRTSFLHGNADFSSYRPRSRIEVLRVATKTMNLWMYVIRQLESALSLCEQPCGGNELDSNTRCDDLPVRAWDQAYAYYAGSLEHENGQGGGNLLFDLADNMCRKTNTCSGSDRVGTANVNAELVELFTNGQLAVLRRQCREGYDIKEKIVSLMTVPLIQAVLHEAYYQYASISETQDITKIQRVSYTSALLPLIHHCNRTDAERIYFSMGLDVGTTSNATTTAKKINFESIKRSLENNYACLGVTCSSVGGVWDGSTFGTNASPCTFDETSSKWDITLVATLSVLVCVTIVLVAGVVIARRRLTGIDHNYKEESDDSQDAENGQSFESSRWQLPDIEGELTTVPLD
jgi:Low iron-inducible periplasmic protein